MTIPGTYASASITTSLRLYFRLLTYVRPYIGWFAVSIAGYVVFASSQPMLASLLKYFVDGLADPTAATFAGVPLIGGLQMMHAVPQLIVLIAA